MLEWFLMDFVDKYGRPFIGFAFWGASLVMSVLGQKSRSIRFLMSSHRISNGKSRMINRHVVNNKPDILSECLRWVNERDNDVGSVEMAIGRTIILKQPVKEKGDITEKGVLLITFTDSCAVLFKEFDFERIGKDYYIVLEPSWAGYCLPEILVWATLSHPVIVEATEPLDYSFIQNFSDNLHPIAIGASNWVDSRYFYPLAEERVVYDAIYVTNYNRIKRHHVFFRAIARARENDSGFKAAMACGAAGEDRDLVHALIDYYGVRDCLDIYENLGKKELNQLLNRSRCNVLLSLKEGSNRSIFESMFSGLPVIVLSNNIGVRKDYINDFTGVLCSDHSLSDDFYKIKTNYARFDPARWALENISPEVSTETLALRIKELEGDPDWGKTKPVLVKVNRPEVEYKNEIEFDPGLNVNAVLGHYRN